LLIWVDPLDGTKEYTLGHDVAHEVTVLIGVAWNGKPIAGVVNQPFFKQDANSGSYMSRVLWGIVGLGAFDLNQGQISVPKGLDNSSTRIVTTRSHITDLIKRDLSAIPNSTLLHKGGAGYKFLTVIDGNADYYIYPRDGTKRWDTCAPEAIMRSLNGTMTDIFGNDYSYAKNELNVFENCYGLIASVHKDNSGVLPFISEELKQQVNQEVEKLMAKKKTEQSQ
jgi:3'(2'), 5'-bisphosphate nucleotidase